jgi:hypothetical protein
MNVRIIWDNIFSALELEQGKFEECLLSLISTSRVCKHVQFKICRTIISPVVLYGCETAPLKKTHRLRMSEIRVLKRLLNLRQTK